MSLAARCPWCETVFRLTEGQISAKGGMARCGVCSHTFNALDALLSDSAVAALERGAQAREANQEATTARAIEQNAAKLPEPVAIPISIRKVFGGSGTPAPAPSSPPPALTSASLSALQASFLGHAADKSPSAAAAPTTAPVPPPDIAPPTPTPATPATAPGAQPAVAHLAAEKTATVNQAAAPERQVDAQRSSTPSESRAAARVADHPSHPETISEATKVASKSETPDQPAAASDSAVPAPIPIDYKVEMPNYDAERAAALAEAERLQKEQREQLDPRNSKNAGTAAENELDAIQGALSPTSTAAAAEDDVADLKPAASTLHSWRLQHAAVHAASAADLQREAERLGPNTFQPSFLESSQPSGRFRRTRRFFGSVLALLLLLGLLAQATYWWRSDVALKVPQAKPYLVRACQKLNCEVDPPAQIDQLSIESSELVAAPGSAGALSFTALIRNHSGNALAYPAIEITLTDAHDQAILRRVFLPDSYLGDPLGNKRLTGLAGNSEYTLKLTFNTSGIATSGYRAGIFYP